MNITAGGDAHDEKAHVLFYATCLAGIGGILWACGVLGKRLGVHGSPNAEKAVRASCTIFVYTLTTVIAPLVDFCFTEKRLIDETFHDPEFVGRILGIVFCGVISGLGGLLGTIAFAWSAGINSALISMVENGMYTISGAILISVCFKERPALMGYIAASLILGGILLAQTTSIRTKKVKEIPSSVPCSAPESEDTDGSGTTPNPIDDGSESDDSGNSHSQVAPSTHRRRAVLLAIIAGICWGFGPLGKKYGVTNAPADRKHVWTTCSYLIYISTTTWIPLANIISSNRELRSAALQDRQFLYLLAGVFGCGLLAGLGGLVSTLAFAHAGNHAALISVVENGVYTVGGAFLITVMFKEWPTTRQLVAAFFVVAGLVISALR